MGGCDLQSGGGWKREEAKTKRNEDSDDGSDESESEDSDGAGENFKRGGKN